MGSGRVVMMYFLKQLDFIIAVLAGKVYSRLEIKIVTHNSLLRLVGSWYTLC